MHCTTVGRGHGGSPPPPPPPNLDEVESFGGARISDPWSSKGSMIWACIHQGYTMIHPHLDASYTYKRGCVLPCVHDNMWTCMLQVIKEYVPHDIGMKIITVTGYDGTQYRKAARRVHIGYVKWGGWRFSHSPSPSPHVTRAVPILLLFSRTCHHSLHNSLP